MHALHRLQKSATRRFSHTLRTSCKLCFAVQRSRRWRLLILAAKLAAHCSFCCPPALAFPFLPYLLPCTGCALHFTMRTSRGRSHELIDAGCDEFHLQRQMACCASIWRFPSNVCSGFALQPHALPFTLLTDGLMIILK